MDHSDYAVTGAPSTPSVLAWLNAPTSVAEHLNQRLRADAVTTTSFGTHWIAGTGNQYHNADIHIIINGCPKWTTAEYQKLHRQQGAARTLWTVYQQHGNECWHYLQGAFVAIILVPGQQRLLAAIDKLGQQGLYYRCLGQSIGLSTSLAPLATALTEPAPLRPQAFFDYLYYHMIPSPMTVYEGIAKLPAATCLTYENGRLTTKRYWQPPFQESQDAPLATLNLELLDLVRTAVDRLRQGPSVGAYLSGGLDSSTVAGALAGFQEAPTFSIGFDAEGYDEIGYARTAAQHFGTQQHEYYVTPADVTDAISLISAAYDEPFGNSSAIPAYYCAKLAQENGVTRLLAGDGGDELFAGNARYANQYIFELYHHIPAALRRSFIEPLLAHSPTVFPFTKAKSYIAQANIPLPDRLESYNFLQRTAVADIFTADYLATIDVNAPLRLKQRLYQAPTGASDLNRMLYLDWQQTLADNDLRKVNQTAALGGIEVAYPLLDDDLVAFSCRLPSTLKLKRRQLRYFYRQAMEGFLPPAVLQKRKHGFGLPFGVWMQTHKPLQELAYDNLLAIKNRYIVRADFIDQLINLHRTGHAGYYGEFIWVLMMLELWLKQHQQS